MEIPPQGEMIGPLVSGLATALVVRGRWCLIEAADPDELTGAVVRART
jgi:hypothetical protein